MLTIATDIILVVSAVLGRLFAFGALALETVLVTERLSSGLGVHQAVIGTVTIGYLRIWLNVTVGVYRQRILIEAAERMLISNQ